MHFSQFVVWNSTVLLFLFFPLLLLFFMLFLCCILKPDDCSGLYLKKVLFPLLLMCNHVACIFAILSLVFWQSIAVQNRLIVFINDRHIHAVVRWMCDCFIFLLGIRMLSLWLPQTCLLYNLYLSRFCWNSTQPASTTMTQISTRIPSAYMTQLTTGL